MTIEPTPQRIPTWYLRDGLRKAREDAGLDQGELAERIELSRASVSDYERGVRTPKRGTIREWAFACNVDAEWLLGLPRLDSNQQPAVNGTAEVIDLDDYRPTRAYLSQPIDRKSLSLVVSNGR